MMPDSVPRASAQVQQAFANSTLTLDPNEPPQFVLHYRGPVASFHGKLCYGFAGYTETCFKPDFEWLTPATRIALYAPANVPAELLRAYRLEVSAPRMFKRQFSYYVSSDKLTSDKLTPEYQTSD